MDRDAEIARLKDRFDAVSKDLLNMTRSKRGTPWHVDRVRDRMRIGRQIDRLEGLDEVPSYGAFNRMGYDS
jgi:hypothetical protein